MKCCGLENKPEYGENKIETDIKGYMHDKGHSGMSCCGVWKNGLYIDWHNPPAHSVMVFWVCIRKRKCD